MSDSDVLSRVVIREARPEDDVTIGELLISAYVTQYAKKLPEVVYTEERKRELRDVAARRAVATVMVAEVDGEVAGTVALFPPGAPGAEAWLPRMADLRGLATAVKFHGAGLAKPLLDAAHALARKWGVDSVGLHVRRGAEGVGRMYQRHGYVRVPEGDMSLPTVYLEAYQLSLK
ncbi:GNAT family N-acetyltransferase [Myxococcus stipitatus]|uniref:GNAT family N-acetyltransferase n=1 Tax=Myxococcus stipitatus TaxID=83455 RepID=UPI001F35CEB1|nr:GNAT family N-acetyltransferase [Myxococcus stipitatus]MCE9668554.1 GNAT family N-acetyltransferase [Myxococcus stipitatus]